MSQLVRHLACQFAHGCKQDTAFYDDHDNKQHGRLGLKRTPRGDDQAGNSILTFMKLDKCQKQRLVKCESKIRKSV